MNKYVFLKRFCARISGIIYMHKHTHIYIYIHVCVIVQHTTASIKMCCSRLLITDNSFLAVERKHTLPNSIIGGPEAMYLKKYKCKKVAIPHQAKIKVTK